MNNQYPHNTEGAPVYPQLQNYQPPSAPIGPPQQQQPPIYSDAQRLVSTNQNVVSQPISQPYYNYQSRQYSNASLFFEKQWGVFSLLLFFSGITLSDLKH